jgi:NAD(P)-dependent dehydrogenase (short-subunit alcohol dehydrogenase family)
LIKGIGLSLARYILRYDPQLTVVSTSRTPKETKSAILKDQDDTISARLRVLDLDITKEDTIQSAREQIEKEFGRGGIKCLFNISGIVFPLDTNIC